MPISEAQRQQRVNAGKASYKAMLTRAFEWYGLARVDDAASWLSCRRLQFGFVHKRGLTRNYVLRKWWEIGLLADYPEMNYTDEEGVA